MPVQDALGKTMDEIFPSDLAKRIIEADKKILRKGELVKVDEELNGRFYTTIKFPIKIKGKPRYLAGFTIDITERKLAEEELKTILNTAIDGFCFVGRDGNILDTNYSFCQMIGYSRDELLNMNISNLEVLDTEKEIKARINSMLKEGSSQFETKHRRKDGKIIDIEARISTLPEKPDILFVFMHDITERKKAEEEIKKTNELLEQLYKNLNEVRENERAEMSREIHDELGQTLTALKMDLNWANENIETNTNAKDKLNRMIELVNATIKKVQRLSADLRPSILDDLGLIPAIEWFVAEFEDRSGLNCKMNLNEVPSLDSKANLTLFRILQEALTNVVRHANAKQISINLNSYSDKICLEIEDDGKGFNVSEMRSTGSIGLLGMKERIKQFNGDVEINSVQNKGTKLSISIPLNNQRILKNETKL